MAVTPRDIYAVLNIYPWKMLVKNFIGTGSASTDLTIFDAKVYRDGTTPTWPVAISPQTQDTTIVPPGTTPTTVTGVSGPAVQILADDAAHVAPRFTPKKISFITFITKDAGDVPTGIGYCCRADYLAGIRDPQPEDAFV